jgi:hypothetical protein
LTCNNILQQLRGTNADSLTASLVYNFQRAKLGWRS